MVTRKLISGALVFYVFGSQILSAMVFDFGPLASLCRIEVHLSTGFVDGKVRGTFGRISGNLQFSPENPQVSKGKIVLASRSLRFGNTRVNQNTHAPDWLDSTKHPEISFQLDNLTDLSWHGKELRAQGQGILTIKGVEKPVGIPLSIHYSKDQRHKYDGKHGDLLKIQGLLNIPRSQFGLASGDFIGSVMEDIEIRVFITGVSGHPRAMLPSKLFGVKE